MTTTTIRISGSLVAAVLLALAASAISLRAVGTINLTGATYTQDFDTLAVSGMSSTLPIGWEFAEIGTNANTAYAAGDGGANGGNTYSFGTGTSTDRALGGLFSGSLNPIVGASFTNGSSGTITSLDIAYVGEQWRLGVTNRTNADRLDFQYSLDATSLTTGTWVNVDTLDFVSPVSLETLGAKNGNLPAYRTSKSATITDISFAPGATLWIRWTDFDVAPGADDGLAVDDFSLTPHGDGVGGSTNPTLTGGLATPSSVSSGDSVLLTIIAGAGLNPTSATLNVSGDLTAIGGSATAAFFDNGTNGDVAAGDKVFSLQTVVDSATAAGVKTLPIAISDDLGRNGASSIGFTVTQPLVCDPGVRTSTAIHDIQGGGLTAVPSFLGQVVEVEGIVVADLQLSSQLSGFYLQEPDGLADGSQATSEGIFVFDSGNGLNVSLGDRVRVKGTVAEFNSSNGTFLGTARNSSLTEIASVQNKRVCSSGNLSLVTPATVTLPTPTATEDLEAFEGMLVSIPTRLVVTGNFSLGTFGQVDLAPSVQFQPSHSPDKLSWPARLDLIKRSVVALDDASSRSNASLYPTLFPQGGLSASNTLRIGDIVNYDAATQTTTPLVGILDDRFGAYRVHPTEPVTFFAANPRPAIAPIVAAVGGRFRAVSANVLNFFTTFGSRGAANQVEFDGQKTKIVEELIGMNPDVIGLSEVQNFVNGGTSGGTYTNSALQSLVDGLNCRLAGFSPLCAGAPAGPFTFIDTVPNGVQNDTDAIRNAVVYRADRLATVGAHVLRSQIAPDFGNRPSLAQTFQPAPGVGPKPEQQRFTFVVNHFRSKGSACTTVPDDNDPVQGNCNGTRLRMAQNILAWLATNPTGDPTPAASRRFLLVGDFNAYYGEDPIQYFQGQGYWNLIANILGPSAYSYNFGSQRGYLDHAVANGPMNSLVKGVAEWHNNSDEPSSLQALDTNIEPPQADYYDPDAFAASDHDPILIGFNTLPGDLNDDGVVDVADQRLITGSVGRSAASVDRRMDYDGDGVITMNDYRLWMILYRAFLQ